MALSKSKRSFYYAGRTLKRVGDGYKYNGIDAETGDRYWVSGPKVRGGDKMHGGIVEIDEDAREEYWVNTRNHPSCSGFQRMHRSKFPANWQPSSGRIVKRSTLPSIIA